MKIEFDKILKDKYGIIFGNKKLIFIKTGRGGSCYGHNNKYLNFANKISKLYGYSVVISSYPAESICNLQEEFEEIKSYIADYEDVYFIGISAGALLGAQQGYLNDKITRMLLVNGPLMINWPKTKRGIERFQGESVEMIYGTKDPSYRYYEILNCINSDKFMCAAIEKADHNFAGMEEILESKMREFIQV